VVKPGFMEIKKTKSKKGKQRKKKSKAGPKRKRLKVKKIKKKVKKRKKIKRRILKPRSRKFFPQDKIENLIKKGQERGFVTMSEILYSFPKAEKDIKGLEQLYESLEEKGIEVKEVKEFLIIKKKGKAKAARRKPAAEERLETGSKCQSKKNVY